MTFLMLYSGCYFDPFHPDKEKISLKDIAHSLSMLCRFNGHCKRFYSVAEHCILMSRYIDKEFAKEALIHDAPEAYTGDLISPIKYSVSEWLDLEAAIAQVVNEVLLGYQPSAEASLAVKESDIQMLQLEMKRNMQYMVPDIGYNHPGSLKYVDKDIHFWSPYEAEQEYLLEANQLGIQG